MSLTPISIRLKQDERHALEQQAAIHGTTVAGLVRDAIRLQRAQFMLDTQAEKVFGAVAGIGERLAVVEAQLAEAAEDRKAQVAEFNEFKAKLKGAFETIHAAILANSGGRK
jgi:hypothetical protein